MWNYVAQIIGHVFHWGGDDIGDAFHKWISNLDCAPLRALPIILIWGAWFSRNLMIFLNIFIPPHAYVDKILAILEHFLQVKKFKPNRIITEDIINHTNPWCYFDGVVQGQPSMGGIRGVLYINDSH